MTRWLIAALALALAPAHAQPPEPSADPTADPIAAPDGGVAGERTLVDDLDEDRPLELGAQLRIFRQARRRKAEIERMEAQLDRRARRMKDIQDEIESRYKTLRLLQEEITAQSAAHAGIPQASIEARAAEETAAREDKVRRLSKVVDKMKADDAARMLEVMDEPLVVDVMLQLKSKQAGRILGEMDPTQAARIGEQMARIKQEKKRGR